MITPGSPHTARIQATRRFTDAGVASPAYDAAELLAHVVGMQQGLLPMAGGLDEKQAAAYEDLVVRREAREPLQHILGTAHFGGLELSVGPGVFIPRPETELLVEHVADRLRGNENPEILDLCSGSGAVALALKRQLPGAVVTAVEIEEAAAHWARRNVQTLDLDVTVVRADATENATFDGFARVDAITCNPPYIPLGVAVSHEVSAFDPAVALWGGEDGLDVIRLLLPVMARLLKSAGIVAIEHHDDHQSDLIELMRRFRDDEAAPFSCVQGHRDLAGRPRFVSAVRR